MTWKIIIAAGQSNMVSVKDSLAAGDEYQPDLDFGWTSSRIMQWSADGKGDSDKANISVIARDPLLYPAWNDSAERVSEYANSPAMEFARQYLRTLAPQDSICIVPVAMRGTGFSGSPSWGGQLYTQMIDTAKAARDELVGEITAIVWIQGESDAGDATYSDKLKSLIADARVDLSVSDLPFISGGMVPEYMDTRPDYQLIDAQHRTYPMEIDNAFHVAGPRGTNPAGIHYSEKGYRLLGSDMADAMSYVKTLTAQPPGEVSGIIATASDQISFTSPSTGAHAYVIYRRLAGTSDPYLQHEVVTTDEYTGPGHGVIITLAGFDDGNQYDVRVAARSRNGDSLQSSSVILGDITAPPPPPPPPPPAGTTEFDADFEGTDGDTVFTEASHNALVITCNGTAKISNALAASGSTSLDITGTQGNYARIPHDPDLWLADKDFFIGMNIKRNGNGGLNREVFMAKYDTGGSQREWYLARRSGNLKFGFSPNGGSISLVKLESLMPSDWDSRPFPHVAVSREGNTIRLFFDGVLIGTHTSSTAVFQGTGDLLFGSLLNSGTPSSNSYFNGHIDNAKIVIGSAVHTTDFTPPA